MLLKAHSHTENGWNTYVGRIHFCCTWSTRADAPTLRVPYVFYTGKCGDVRGVVLHVEPSALIFLECPKVFARMEFEIVRGLCVRLPWYSRETSASHAENVRGSARSLRWVLDTFTGVCGRPRLFLVYSTYATLMYDVYSTYYNVKVGHLRVLYGEMRGQCVVCLQFISGMYVFAPSFTRQFSTYEPLFLARMWTYL